MALLKACIAIGAACALGSTAGAPTCGAPQSPCSQETSLLQRSVRVGSTEGHEQALVVEAGGRRASLHEAVHLVSDGLGQCHALLDHLTKDSEDRAARLQALLKGDGDRAELEPALEASLDGFLEQWGRARSMAQEAKSSGTRELERVLDPMDEDLRQHVVLGVSDLVNSAAEHIDGILTVVQKAKGTVRKLAEQPRPAPQALLDEATEDLRKGIEQVANLNRAVDDGFGHIMQELADAVSRESLSLLNSGAQAGMMLDMPQQHEEDPDHLENLQLAAENYLTLVLSALH